MIFSKDKKPTEAGWWWRLNQQTGEPLAQYIYLGAKGVLVGYVIGRIDTINHILWGDRIPTPTIDPEQPEGTEV